MAVFFLNGDISALRYFDIVVLIVVAVNDFFVKPS